LGKPAEPLLPLFHEGEERAWGEEALLFTLSRSHCKDQQHPEKRTRVGARLC
jgi:hypothetical protein